jgi:citrate synthase
MLIVRAYASGLGFLWGLLHGPAAAKSPAMMRTTPNPNNPQ